MNHPVRIQFTNGNVTEYVYTISGEKLRTIYRTAVSNISVPMGTTHTLTHGETLSVDSTDYCFGGIIADISTNQNLQPNKYNGKELDLMHGLNTYDYSARLYEKTTNH